MDKPEEQPYARTERIQGRLLALHTSLVAIAELVVKAQVALDDGTDTAAAKMWEATQKASALHSQLDLAHKDVRSYGALRFRARELLKKLAVVDDADLKQIHHVIEELDR